MTRTLRGAWSRRGTLLPLLLLTAVVVAGLVCVLAFAAGTGTSPAVAVPLLLLGAVAVPATGRHLAAVRRGEIALARLRGVTGGQLYVVLALEPFLVLAAGALAGVLLGLVVGRLSAATWIDAEVDLLSSSTLTAVLGVVAAGLAAVLVGMAGAMREPLADQVRVAQRPRASSTAALFGSVLLIVAAAVALYRAAVAEATGGDWVVLAGPALVGLAVGQLTVWALRLLGTAAVPWTARRALPGFLAARRLARVADAASPVRLVVAACVVAAVSLTGAQQVGDWADDTSRLRAGAPLRVDLDGDVNEALALTRDLDPEGTHLMAAALVPGEGSVPARRAFVDTSRYDAVLGDFYARTPAAGVGGRGAALTTTEGSTIGTGSQVRVAARGLSTRPGGTLDPEVVVEYLDGTGQPAEATVRLSLAESGAPVEARTDVTGCEVGCVVTGLRAGRSVGDARLPYVLTALDFAGVDVLALDLRATTPQRWGVPGGPVVVDDGLMVLADRRVQTAEPGARGGARVPVLATTSATWPEGPTRIDSPGGDERAVEVVDRLPALPLVEADGVLADLPLLAAGASPTVPAAQVMVLAAADTPASLLDALTRATGTDTVSLADVERVTDAEVGAVQARVYALTALFCLLVAGLVIAASVTRLRAQHLAEVAALRVVGVDLSPLRRAGRIEVAALGLGALLAAAAGGVTGVGLLLAQLRLVTVPEHGIPLQITVSAVPVAVTALTAALVVAAVGGRARTVRAALGRPDTLREQVR